MRKAGLLNPQTITSHCTGVGSTANNTKAAQEWRNKLLTVTLAAHARRGLRTELGANPRRARCAKAPPTYSLVPRPSPSLRMLASDNYAWVYLWSLCVRVRNRICSNDSCYDIPSTYASKATHKVQSAGTHCIPPTSTVIMGRGGNSGTTQGGEGYSKIIAKFNSPQE